MSDANEFKMPQLEGAITDLPFFESGSVVLSKDTFIHIIHALRNQRFIETKPMREQRKRQAVIDDTYDWMLDVIANED